MNIEKLLYLLQFTDASFPVGGFSQSWGLETYVFQGKVKDADSLSAFLKTHLSAIAGTCDGPLLLRAIALSAPFDEDALLSLETLSCAAKLTRESRESSLRMGKALLRIASQSLDDPALQNFYSGRIVSGASGNTGITYAVAFGLLCGRLAIPEKEAVTAFVYSTVNAIVQSGVKLIPLGNTEAQGLIAKLHGPMEAAVQQSLSTPAEEISTFCPCLDLAGMEHEILPIRLYMS